MTGDGAWCPETRSEPLHAEAKLFNFFFSGIIALLNGNKLTVWEFAPGLRFSVEGSILSILS